MLISGGGGGKSLPAVGAPTLTLLLATAAELDVNDTNKLWHARSRVGRAAPLEGGDL